jgi:hypothetical protein
MLNSVDADPQLIAGWQPFFAVSAGAAAALAGLLFVALSIHAQEIAEHPPFRYRALAMLSIPTVVLVVPGLMLLPRQTRFLDSRNSPRSYSRDTECWSGSVSQCERPAGARVRTPNCSRRGVHHLGDSRCPPVVRRAGDRPWHPGLVLPDLACVDGVQLLGVTVRDRRRGEGRGRVAASEN